MRYLIFWISLVFMIIGVHAFADTDPAVVDNPRGCTKYTFCAAQTATGDCTVLPASGDELVLRTAGRSLITFWSIRSVGAHVCDIMSNDTGHDAASGTGLKINAVSLTAATPSLTLSGPLDYVWVTCPTIGTSTTVTGLVCPANN